MDLISLLSEKSISDKTIVSADTDNLKNQNERTKHKELVAYYSQVMQNKCTEGKKPAKRYQARLDGKCNRTCDDLPASNTNKKLMIIDDHDTDTKNTTSKKLMLKNIDSFIHHLKTKSDNYNHVTCSKNIPRVETEPKVTYKKCNKDTNTSNTYQSMNTNQILQSKCAEKTTYCRPFLEIHETEPKLAHVKSKNIRQPINTSQTIAPKYVEKTTYCRPVLEMYNQAFIFKTMERNARLQGLVRRLVIAREREKEKVTRNNYVNELKNKYKHNNSESRTIPNYGYYPPEVMNLDVIDDYYNTRFAWEQSDPCQNLLEDFYSASNETHPDNYNDSRRPFRNIPYNYANNRYCYPTSSQRRLMMVNRERPKHQLPHPLLHGNRCFQRNTIIVDKDNYINYHPTNRHGFKRSQSSKLLNFKKHNVIKSLSIQTDLSTFKVTSNDDHNRESIKDKYNRVSSNVERLKQKIVLSENEVKFSSLAAIENKLDVLIDSINAFIEEIKSKRVADTKSEAVSCEFSAANTIKSGNFGLMRKEQIVCGMVQEKPRSSLAFNEENFHNAKDEILYEESSKSDKVKRDIEEILNKSCVQLTFDISTKERATEITDSLIKARLSKGVVVEELDSGDTRQITIAVNTDPLGLLALLRVSTEAMKQILSYMPQIDYYSYLSRLQFPQLARGGVSHYICNICGAAFGRPSQLSDHIQQHNLGNSRDCCVCRHVLDMQRHRSGLFPCRHCGQQFTRAYCRQLHEQTCAHASRLASESPSLMLLR